MPAVDNFNRQIEDAISSNIPIHIVCTKEAKVVSDLIKSVAFTNNRIVKKWNSYNGFQQEVSHLNSINEISTKIIDVDSEMSALSDALNQLHLASTADSGSVCIFSWPHWQLKDGRHDVIHALLKNSYELCVNKTTLFLTMPPPINLPIEVESQINIIHFDGPDREDIIDFVNSGKVFSLTNSIHMKSMPVLSDSNVYDLASSLSGLTYYEITMVLSKILAENRGDSIIEPSILIEKANRIKSGIIKKTNTIEVLNSAPLESVGGLPLLKKWIQERKSCFSKEAEEYGVSRPKGVLLLGHSGGGKSMAAKCIASVLGFPLLKLDISQVFSKLVGDSENNMRLALSTIGNMSPCIVYVDEIDKVFQNTQSDGDSGVTKRVLSTILNYMQESTQPIFWVFTANRISCLPPELLRPGRIDDKFLLLLPTPPEILEIINIHLEKRKQKKLNKDKSESLCNYAYSKSFSGAELEGAVNEAVIQSFNNKKKIDSDMLLDILTTMKPTAMVNPKDYLEIQHWGMNNAKLASDLWHYDPEILVEKQKVRLNGGKTL